MILPQFPLNTFILHIRNIRTSIRTGGISFFNQFSIMSRQSRVKSLSSILKSPGIRSQLFKKCKKVYFKCPTNIKDILFNFETRNRIKDYDDLICSLRGSNIKNNDLMDLLYKIRQCMLSLGPVHKSFIKVLLEINWTDRSPEVISAYKIFVEDLISAHIYYVKLIIDKLVEQFKPVKGDNMEWAAGGCKTKDIERLSHICDVLRKILNIVPMSRELLLQSIKVKFPYITHGAHIHEVYVHALLQLLEYIPQLRLDILSLIIDRLMILDVNIPLSEAKTLKSALIKYNDNNPILGNDTNINGKNKKNTMQLQLIAHTLDICMEQVFDFIYNTCYLKGKLNSKSLKNLYSELLFLFEKIILPTYASQYVQYIMFYICSFKEIIVESFVNWLWKKSSDPNIPSILRSTAASYIASLVSTASFVSLRLVKDVQLNLINWIHNYIDIRESSDSFIDNPRGHLVFYSLCQALFTIIINRHKDFIDEENIIYLHQIDLTKIITCKLKPLKICQSDIAHNLADISQMYQLAYQYTIIKHNARNYLPVIYDINSADFVLDFFSPFSTYTLTYSRERLTSLFYNC